MKEINVIKNRSKFIGDMNQEKYIRKADLSSYNEEKKTIEATNRALFNSRRLTNASSIATSRTSLHARNMSNAQEVKN